MPSYPQKCLSRDQLGFPAGYESFLYRYAGIRLSRQGKKLDQDREIVESDEETEGG